jgi:hypothetical protein
MAAQKPVQQPVGHYLLALIAPGSVEAEVTRLQNSLFSAHGYASSVAVSPLIPIAFLAQPMGSAQIQALGRRAPSPYTIAARGFAWEGGTLFLSLDTGGLWENLRGDIRDTGHVMERGSSIIPVHEGFFLGCGEASPKERDEIEPTAPKLCFSSCTLALISLMAPRAGDGWWREVHTEVLLRKVLR